MKKAILYVLLFVAIQVVVMNVVEGVCLLIGSTAVVVDKTTQMIIGLSAANVLALVVFLWKRMTPLSPSWLLTRPWSVLLWTAVASLGMAIPFTWLQEHLPELPNLIEIEMGNLMANYWGYVVIGLLAPLVEEVVFRGAVLRVLLEKLTPWKAIAVSALLFSLVHGNPAQMPYAFIGGMLLGWMYWRTGSIIPGMVYHWVNNSAAYIVSNMYQQADVKLVDIFGSEQHALMAAGFSLMIVIPALWQLYLQMKRADSQH